jgi:hypothetical protein
MDNENNLFDRSMLYGMLLGILAMTIVFIAALVYQHLENEKLRIKYDIAAQCGGTVAMVQDKAVVMCKGVRL